MKKVLASTALVLGGLVAALGLAPAAQAYPELQFEAGVSARIVHEHEVFTASSSANADCAWTHEWNGTSSRGQGRGHKSTWTAPDVARSTVIPMHFTCSYDGSVSAGRSVPVARQTWSRTIDVTVLPVAAPANSAQSVLPNSGGPDKRILLGGLLLLVLGGVAVRAARRRGADAV